MNLSEYRKQRIKTHNRIINFFLATIIGLVLVLLIAISMMEQSFNYFEERSDEVTETMVDIISSNAQDFFSGFELQAEVDSVMPKMPEGNICDSLDSIKLDDENMRLTLEEQCAKGSISSENLLEKVIDSRFAEFEDDMRINIKSAFDDSISQGSNALSEAKNRFPFLKPIVLWVILIVLLISYFFNNGLILTINYAAKKLVFLVGVIFCIPYIMFKVDLAGWVLEKFDMIGMMNVSLPVNPQLIIAQAVKAISEEMTKFYAQYIVYAVIAVVIGAILWAVSSTVMLPKKAKAPEKKQETKVKKEKKV